MAQINARSGQLPAANQQFTYDADGNLTGDGVWTYTWDAENRLTQMTPTALAVSSGMPNIQLTFSYDYMNRRVQKRVASLASGGGEVLSRRFVYDGWNVVAEYAAPGGTSITTIIRSYTWGLDIARSMTDAGGVGALVQIVDHASQKSFFPAYEDSIMHR